MSDDQARCLARHGSGDRCRRIAGHDDQHVTYGNQSWPQELDRPARGAADAVTQSASESTGAFSIDGDKIYADALAFCYGVAGEAVAPYKDFSYRERQIINRIAEWMGSRDCEIAKLKAQA